MIVHKPSILLIDEAFDGIEDGMKLRILERIFEHKGWTIVSVSHDPEIVQRTNIVHVLVDGKILESGAPYTLMQKQSPEFSRLFPLIWKNEAGNA
jgi:ABC-type bacteriocin/lantibiotic exporter with double-glycine peptidase domain